MTTTAFNGDCLKVMKDLSDASIDCFICDLPYGCLTNQTGESKGFISENQNEEVKKKLAKQSGEGCAWDIKINLTEFWKQVKRLSKNEHTPVLMFCTTKFGYELIKSNESWFRYDLVWDKQRGVSFLQANRMPMRSHEMIYVFSQQGAAYQRVDISGNFKAWTQGGRGIGNVYGNARSIGTTGGEGKRCALSVIPINEIEEEQEQEQDHEMIYVFADKGAAYQRVDISGNFKRSSRNCGTSKIYNQAERFDSGNDNTGKRCALSVIPINEIEEEQEQEQEQDHEMIYVFADKGAAYQRVDISGNFTAFKSTDSKEHEYHIYTAERPNFRRHTKDNDGTKRCALSLIQVKGTSGKGKHPTEKPKDLYKWLIERYSKPGDTVLDPTAGSFNSCIVANELGRNAIGIEMNLGFFDKACAKMGLV